MESILNYDTYKPIAFVDVKSLRENIEAITPLLCGSKLYAVVKSDAYGHGIEIARFMKGLCYGFAVSSLSEAIKLRFLGITEPILMLVPISKGEYKNAVDYNVTVLVDSLKTLDTVLSFNNFKSKIKLALKVNTGMNRLGFDDINCFFEALKLCKRNGFVVSDVLSHFYNADSKTDCDSQYKSFLPYSKLYKNEYDGLCHISASGGLLRGGYEMDAARVGIMLYGYKNCFAAANRQIVIKPIMSIKAKAITKRKLLSNENALYNCKADKALELAVVNYGYADGFRKAKINRTMDISLERLNKDGFVTILDDAAAEAERLDTITYEVLTHSASRLQKVYINQYENYWRKE